MDAMTAITAVTVAGKTFEKLSGSLDIDKNSLYIIGVINRTL